MNRSYKSIWNEATGTFVAVAENVNTKGKRSSSVRKGGILAAVGALTLSATAAMAAVDIPESGNEINFDSSGGSINFGDGGSINFGDGGSITGLADLTISGALSAGSITTGEVSASTVNATGVITAAQVTVGSDAALAAGSKEVVTGGQLKTTNDTVETNKLKADAAITAVDGRVDQNVTAIGDINTTLTNLGVDATKPGSGIKYFRANSTAADAEAAGDDSVAIGPNAKSEGAKSLAAGNEAAANEENSVALGNKAIADGTSTIALGDGAQVNKGSNGSDPEAAIAIGKDSRSSGTASIAMGQEANASGANALALGSKAQAGGTDGIALGNGAVAAAQSNISIGSEAGKGTVGNTPNDWQHNIAIGDRSGQRVGGQFNLALGDQAGNDVAGNDNIAFGRQAGSSIKGLDNISIGQNANTGVIADRSVSIGQNSKALTEGVAIGVNSSSGDNGLALGNRAKSEGQGVALGRGASAAGDFVALGAGSVARQEDVTGLGRFTNATFSGHAVSVGSGVAGNEFTRRIVNVADGSADTDAVNVRQLQHVADQFKAGGVVDYDILADKVSGNWSEQIADSKSKYVSVNDGGVDQANKDNSGASAVDSVAIGPGAATKLGTSDSVAIGHDALAEASSAVVLGHDIKGLGVNSTTIGNSKSQALGTSGIAIGTDAVSRDTSSIVIGTEVEADRQANGDSVERSIVIGTYTQSTAVDGIAIGSGTMVNAPRGIAQGSNAFTTAADAMAFGTGTRASGVASQASGLNAKAYAARGIATGQDARSGEANPNVEDAANNRDSIAIGTSSVAEKNSSIALGSRSAATANFAQAFGENAKATAEESIAQGRNAVASKEKAVAVGSGAEATAVSASAFGAGANAVGENASAFGAGATAQNPNSVAIGAGAKAESNRSVALGDGAIAGGATGTSSATLNGLTYGGFAGTAPVATVSVGTETEKRTITNVAAGRISNTSTDAINGSQLHATNAVLGNVANTTKNILGGNAALDPNGSLIITNIGNTGKGTIHEAIMVARTEVRKGTNVSDVAKTQGADGHDIYTINADGTSVSAGAGLAVTPGAKDTNNVTDYKVDLSQDTKDSLVKADSALQTVVTQVDGVDVKTLDKDDNNANFVSGTNIQLSDDGQGGIQVATKEDVVFENTTINNDLTVGGVTKLGDNFVVNADNSVEYSGPITKGDHITNKTYVDGVVGDLGDTPLTFAGDSGTNVERKLGETVVLKGGAVDAVDLTDGNIGVVANGTDTLEIKLNKDIDLRADGSLTIGDTLVDNDGLTVDDGADNLTEVGAGSIAVTDAAGTTVIGGNQISVGGNHSIVISGDTGTIGGLQNTTFDPNNYESGQAATEDQLKQVSDVANAGWNLTGSGDNEVNIGPDGKVNFVGDNNLTVAQTGVDQNGEIKITLNENIDLGVDGSLTTGNTVVDNSGLTVDDTAGNKTAVGAGSIAVTDAAGTTVIGGNQISVGGNHSIVISGDTGTIGGLQNTTFDPNNYESGQAATEDQLKQVSDVANAGWNLTGSGDNEVNIGPDGKVNFVGDNNLTVAQTGVDQNGEIKITLNENIDLGVDGSLTTGNTVVDNSGLTVDDTAGNKTAVGAGSIAVTDAAGNNNTTTAMGTTLTDNAGNTNVTTAAGMKVSNQAGDVFTDVGAGAITIAGTGPNGANKINIGGKSGDITGLSNTTLDSADFAQAGRAATEEQLKQGLATATTEVEAGKNIKVTKENPDPNKQSVYTVETLADVDFDSVTSADATGNKTVLNKEGIAVVDEEGNKAEYSAAGLILKDKDGFTTNVAATQITVGGSNPILMDGAAGMITGLTNTNWSGPTFAKAGRAATEEQLKPLGDFLGFADGNYTFNYNGKDHKNLAEALDSIHWNVEAPDAGGNTAGNTGGGTGGNSGSNNSGSDTTSKTPIANTNTVGFKGDSNLTVSKTERVDSNGDVIGADIQYTLNKDIKVDSITAINVNATNVTANEVTINNGPVINQNGIDMRDKQITNVADGVAPKDAVNVSQLENVKNDLHTEIGGVRRDLHKVDRKLRAGIAAAMATAALPQAYLPGKSMVGIGGGTWNGESGVALGVSTITDNGKWVFKFSGNASTRGDYGGTVGAGYQW